MVALWIDGGDALAKCCCFFSYRLDDILWEVTVFLKGRKNFLVALVSKNVDLVSSETQVVVVGLVLEEAAVFEVVADDNVGNGIEDKLKSM